MRVLLRFFVLGVAFVLSTSTASAASPQDVIASLHAALLEAMKMGSKSTTLARYERLRPKLDEIYDFRRMIEVASGSHWAAADPATQTQLADAFARLSVMTYASRFNGYDGEQFTITGERPGTRDTVLVGTEIDRGANAKIAPGEERVVPITYVLAQTDGNWRIIDVLLDQTISELAVRRSEYSKILRDGGAPALIPVLEDKANQLQKEP